METINFWQNKNVFITGGNGFLGSWLVKELLEKEANIIVLIYEEDPRSNFYKWELDKKVIKIKGQIEDYNLLKSIINKYEIATVFHLAAQPLVTIALRDPLHTFESNIRGTYNLLEACRNSQFIKEIVIASSDKAYGDHDKQPYTEEFALQGKHPYDVSKSCTDLLAQTYAKTYKLPVVITRSGNFYGGGDLYFDRIIPHAIAQYLMNKKPQLRSDGTHKRDYVYIKDVVDAYITLAEKLHDKNLSGHGFNFGLGKGVSVLEIVETIKKLMNSNLEPEILDTAKAEIQEQYLNAEKISKVVGWKPQYSLEEGLKETIEWYKEFLKNK